MSYDDMIIIIADILQITDAAVLVKCGEKETWLPLSQVEFSGERGDTDVSIALPEWLAEEKDLNRKETVSATPVAEVDSPRQENDGKNCRNCSFCEDDENAPLPNECKDCTRSGFVNGVQDNWRPEQDTSDDEPVSSCTEATFIKTEYITASIPLSHFEREAVGDRMASALQQIARLENDLDCYRKSINAQIKTLQKDAEEARIQWQDGKVEDDVYCDMVADYDSEAIIWRDHETGQEMKRRKMTAEERQYRLPIQRQNDTIQPSEMHDVPTEAIVYENTRICIDCGHFSQNDGAMSEPCQTCSQCQNGTEDNWTPQHECRTCTNAHTKINMPPCSGCSLNAAENHRGDEERWTWVDASQPDELDHTEPPIITEEASSHASV